MTIKERDASHFHHTRCYQLQKEKEGGMEIFGEKAKITPVFVINYCLLPLTGFVTVFGSMGELWRCEKW